MTHALTATWNVCIAGLARQCNANYPMLRCSGDNNHTRLSMLMRRHMFGSLESSVPPLSLCFICKHFYWHFPALQICPFGCCPNDSVCPKENSDSNFPSGMNDTKAILPYPFLSIFMFLTWLVFLKAHCGRCDAETLTVVLRYGCCSLIAAFLFWMHSGQNTNRGCGRDELIKGLHLLNPMCIFIFRVRLLIQ